MGLFGKFIRNQFIEVIEWTDMDKSEMVYRFPVENKEIKMGAQLTVRESQVAVFVNEGQLADVFTAGRYELTTQNMPILTTLKSWKYGFNSPFKAEVYFVSTRQFTNQKWGTTKPVMMRDQDFGLIRLRAYGIFAFKVQDAALFLKELFGTSGSYTVDDIRDQLAKMAVSSLSDLFAESQIPALDISMYYDELSQQGKQKLQTRFKSFGFELSSFTIENVSLPDEVEKAMDKRTSMGVIGNMNNYMRYQTAEAVRDAAQNEGGGMAATGAGMGAGVAIGKMMAGAFNQTPVVSPNTPVTPNEATKACPQCGHQVAKNTKFCPECGAKLSSSKVPCVACGAEINAGSKFCPECGAKQESKKVCPECGNELKQNAKFCPECGTKIQ